MKSYRLPFPMKKGEAIAGWIYFFIHSFFLVELLSLLSVHVLSDIGLGFSVASLNVTYYAIGAAFVFIALFQFMRKSFSLLCDNLANTFIAIIVGYFVYILASNVVQLLLSFVLSDLVNPNSAAINAETKLNPNSMIVVGVILAPIVEEVLFRGVVFGTIRKKSRLVGYAVAALAFAFYHLADSFFYEYHWSLFLYLFQYIPASIVLCWCYEKASNIWGPIFLHMAINFVSIRITLG